MAPLQVIWAVAWQRAHDVARTESFEQVDQLTADLAAATADAEYQFTAVEEAKGAQAAAEH